MNINQATIVGRMVKDPELKSLPNGTHVTNVSIATSRKWNVDGVAKEETEFHNCVAFGKTAEIMHQYLKKGQLVGITGRIQTRSWDGQDGKKLYRTEIIVESMQMGPRAGEGKAPGTAAPSYDRSESQETVEGVANQMEKGVKFPKEEINPDDIPF